MPNLRSNLIKKPWGVVFTVASLTTDSIKVPTGWVIEDLSISGISGSDINISASTDVNASVFQDYSDSDLSGKNIPLSLKFTAASMFYPSGAMVLDWKNIGIAELRSIQVYNNSGWSDGTLVIWGVLIPDPRCFVG